MPADPPIPDEMVQALIAARYRVGISFAETFRRGLAAALPFINARLLDWLAGLPCPTCDGAREYPCPVCKGTGKHPVALWRDSRTTIKTS